MQTESKKLSHIFFFGYTTALCFCWVISGNLSERYFYAINILQSQDVKLEETCRLSSRGSEVGWLFVGDRKILKFEILNLVFLKNFRVETKLLSVS